MTDTTLKILLGIIAVNLTIQTVKDVGLFPTAYAQDDIQKVAICSTNVDNSCAEVTRYGINVFDTSRIIN